MLVKVYFPTDLCDILYASKPENNPDHRLRDASGQLMIMKQYEITDAASYAAAVKMVNTKFYELRSKRKDNYDLSIVLSARITAYEDCKKYQRYYRSWEKKPTQKHSALEKQYEFELQMPRGGGNIAALAGQRRTH